MTIEIANAETIGKHDVSALDQAERHSGNPEFTQARFNEPGKFGYSRRIQHVP